MLGARYLDAVARIADSIREDELDGIGELARRVAAAIRDGGLFYVYDNGHMLNAELFNRAGGLALLAPVRVGRPVLGTDAVRPGGEPAAGEDPDAALEDELTMARMAVRRAGVRAGDVVLLGSVSGRSPLVVEMAEAARRSGALTVALTALSYSASLPAVHPSGRLLYQAADVVLDTHTGAGDAALSVDGLGEKILPTSGVSAALVAWCLIGEVAAELLVLGIEPTVFRSINYPDGPERHRAAMARYRERGY